jgi:hypothetical protein
MLNLKFNLKKLFTMVVIVFCLLVLSAGSALAGSFYVDYMPGLWEERVNSEGDATYIKSGDVSPAIVGFEQNFGLFKLDLEYIDTSMKDCYTDYDPIYEEDYYVDGDYKGFDMKIGYQLTDQLAFIIGYHRYELKSKKSTGYGGDFYDYKYTGVMAGFDTDFPISDKVTISGSLGFGINGKYNYKYYDDYDDINYDESIDMDIIAAKIKFNFALADSLDLSFGYRYTLYNVDHEDVSYRQTCSGLTAGLAYKFSIASEAPKKMGNRTDADQPTTKTLILKNDFHYTECRLIVKHHAGKVKVGDVIQLTADQVKAIKDALCGPYVAPADGELGIRQTWHKLGNKEVTVKELVMYDRNGQIVGASLTVTEVR